jgi:hypothetical protein
MALDADAITPDADVAELVEMGFSAAVAVMISDDDVFIAALSLYGAEDATELLGLGIRRGRSRGPAG